MEKFPNSKGKGKKNPIFVVFWSFQQYIRLVYVGKGEKVRANRERDGM